MHKRFLSALLVFALIFALCPPTAFAASNYGTVDEVALAIRGYLKARTETFTVYLHHTPTSSDEDALKQEIQAAMYEALDKAMAHTGVPTEGDYLRWMWSNTQISYSLGSYSNSGIDLDLTFTLDYFTSAEQEKEMDEAVEKLLDELDLYNATDYEKVCGIYDYIVKNVTYDYDSLNNTSNTLKNTAYAALIKGTSVCQGYATLFYRLALELGVDARVIVGTSEGQDHAWNIVKLDGKYYNVDATFDSNVYEAGYGYQWFLLADANFDDHIRDAEYASDAFYAEYPMAAADYDPNTTPEPTDPEPTETEPSEPEPPETEPEPSETVHTHSYTAIVTAPTCTKKGYTTYTCSCGDSYTDNETAALGHTEVTDAAVEPTCTKTGLTEGSHCSVCETVLEEQETVAALGHSYSDGECTRCGAEDPDYTEPTEPDPTETQPTEPEPTETQPTEPEPTETQPTEPEPTEHTHSYASMVTEPTCTGKGYTIYACSCGDSYTADEVEPLGHSFVNGICSVCGEEDPNEPDHYHVYETWIITEYPSATSDGEKYSVCTVCGETLTTDIMYTEDGSPNGHSLWIANVNGYGDVALSVYQAEAGYDVFLFVDALEGTATESVEILDDDTDEVLDASLTDLGGGYYHFLMPDTDVCVRVTNIRFGDYTVTATTSGGGDVWISTDVANEGEVFLLSVSADDGYYLDEIYLYTNGTYSATGQQISATDFEITMPDGDLIIEVHFILAESPFADVKESDYFCTPVLWAVSNGITSGISADRFGPSNPCTRAQVVTFLWRAAGSPEPVSTENPFTDVSKSNYYYKAVLWAVENGITSGVSATRFGPNNPCTRAQVVTFLWRFCGSPEPTSIENPFTDVKETAYYYEAVLFAVEYGITSGMSETRFGSTNTCTRAHVVTFLYKALHG